MVCLEVCAMSEGYKFQASCGCGFVAKPRDRLDEPRLSEDLKAQMQGSIDQHRFAKECGFVDPIARAEIACFKDGLLHSFTSLQQINITSCELECFLIHTPCPLPLSCLFTCTYSRCCVCFLCIVPLIL